MSALGQKQTSHAVQRMFALSPKAAGPRVVGKRLHIVPNGAASFLHRKTTLEPTVDLGV
jgi:hypothetical protein